MTNNQLTKEWLQNRIADMESTRDDIPFGFDESGNNELAAFKLALAAMDSEPVGKPFMYGIADPDGNAYIDEFCVSEDLGLVEDTVNELNYDREEGDELNYSVVALYRHAQPAPVVPDEMTIRDACKFVQDMRLFDDVSVIVMRTWNACRAAMLQAGNSPVIPGAEQRIADAVELLQKAAPAMLADNGGPDGPLAGRMKSPVIPEGWQVEAEKLAEIYGMSFVLFRHGEAPQCADPTKVVISFTDKGLGHDTLPSGPKEVK